MYIILHPRSTSWKTAGTPLATDYFVQLCNSALLEECAAICWPEVELWNLCWLQA